MKNQVAQTAYRVMFHVALEQYQPDEHRLIHDALTRQMLPARLRLLVRAFGFKPFRQWFLSLIDRISPGARDSGLCRKRYIDDKLVEALHAGIDTIVILGSGLDTRAYRLQQLSTLRVYEVDLPQTVAYKGKKLQQLYGAIPSHVKLVPMDFDCQALEDVLISHGYSLDQKSFFIWEGVTQYISDAAVHAVFEFLAQVKPGSRMVFTYVVKDFIDGEMDYGLERLYQIYRVKNPIWQFGLYPAQIATFLGAYTWKELEQVGADEYRQRYLNPAGRTEPVMEIERAVYAEKSAK
jgi:methyltransferase (TIGR00027 family)